MTSATKSPYAGYRFPGEIISHAVWLSGLRIQVNAFWHRGLSAVGAVPPCHFPAQLEAHCLGFGAWFGPSFQG